MPGEHRSYLIRPVEATVPAVGTWLWALEDAHRSLFAVVRGLSTEALDHRPAGATNTIGTLLYHIAATDLAWLYEDILEREPTKEGTALLPFPYRNDEGSLHPVSGIAIDTHLDRLTRARELLVRHVVDMPDKDFQRVRRLERYDVSVEWILYHLAEHENFHRGQISELRKQALAAGLR